MLSENSSQSTGSLGAAWVRDTCLLALALVGRGALG